jgi:hypothetical protein
MGIAGTALKANRVEIHAPLAKNELAIAQSVLYAALFDYPLTLAELRHTLIESAQTPSQILAAYEDSEPLRTLIDWRNGYFFPRGRGGLVRVRREREVRSRRFLADHGLLLTLLSAMPYVRLVALSGSIAHLNLDGDGDLDLFIVTRGRRVWSVTVAALVIAKLLGQRKTTCVNFVLADTRLAIEQQDFFNASQIVHLKPIVGDDVYRQLVKANPFIQRVYPNFHIPDRKLRRTVAQRIALFVKPALERLLQWPSAAAEWLCHASYRAYLLRRSASWKSPEQVRLEPDCLKLHTQSHRRSILERFDRAVRSALD